MELNYKTYGKGEPVVILHGLFGMLDNWQTFAKELGEHYTVVVPDLPNHGRSPALEPFTYKAAAEAVSEFLQDHWIHECRLMGHSMGGKIAMQMALDHEELVSRLLVVDISPRAYRGGHEEIIEALSGVEPEKAAERGDIKKELMQRIGNESIVLFLMKNLSRRKEGGYRWKFELDILRRAYEDILAPVESGEQYEKPALFLGGSKSDYIREEDAEAIRALFPNAEIGHIEGAGHWVHADKPDELLKRTLEFFR